MALTKVTRSGITDNSINADKIEDGTIVDADITPGTITNAKLAGSITNAKLSNSSITVNGASVSLGGSFSAGSISWQSKITSDGSTVTTMVAGRGYFVDNTSAAGLVKLPTSASAGDTIAIKDYAGNFGTNKLTIQRNGHNIQGVANDGQIGTNRASVVLVYVDATKGWLYTNESNIADLQQALYIEATGGTILTSGDYKTHVFTGDGCFVVSQVGNAAGGPSIVDYLVVAGGGDGTVGGGGAGGFRSSNSAPRSGIPAVSPLDTSTGITVTATTFPITVGAGGGGEGGNSVFSTITSTGGGRGPHYVSNPLNGGNGGSGGGAGGAGNSRGSGGSGNTPPVSPPQGNPGGNATGPSYPTPIHGGSGGGATQAGNNGGTATGGNGAPVATAFFGPTSGCYGTPGPSAGRWFAGGGGSGSDPGQGLANGGKGGGGHGGGQNATGGFFAGTANTGGGGGGSSVQGGPGGKGFVAIRYKFQN